MAIKHIVLKEKVRIKFNNVKGAVISSNPEVRRFSDSDIVDYGLDLIIKELKGNEGLLYGIGNTTGGKDKEQRINPQEGGGDRD